MQKTQIFICLAALGAIFVSTPSLACTIESSFEECTPERLKHRLTQLVERRCDLLEGNEDNLENLAQVATSLSWQAMTAWSSRPQDPRAQMRFFNYRSVSRSIASLELGLRACPPDLLTWPSGNK